MLGENKLSRIPGMDSQLSAGVPSASWSLPAHPTRQGRGWVGRESPVTTITLLSQQSPAPQSLGQDKVVASSDPGWQHQNFLSGWCHEGLSTTASIGAECPPSWRPLRGHLSTGDRSSGPEDRWASLPGGFIFPGAQHSLSPVKELALVRRKNDRYKARRKNDRYKARTKPVVAEVGLGGSRTLKFGRAFFFNWSVVETQ